MGDRSHICVPLFAGDEPVGALSVMSTSEEERLNEEDRQTLELLAGVLSEGVSRAAEFEAKRRQVDALARFEAIYHGAITGVMTLSNDGQIVDANPAMCALLGLENSEQVRTHIAEYLDPEEHERVTVACDELFAGESNSLRIETRLNRRDGSVVWVSASFSIVREPDGRPVVRHRDGSGRHRAQGRRRTRCCASRRSTSTRRSTTASPASPTAPCSATGSSRRSRSPSARAARWRWR